MQIGSDFYAPHVYAPHSQSRDCRGAIALDCLFRCGHGIYGIKHRIREFIYLHCHSHVSTTICYCYCVQKQKKNIIRFLCSIPQLLLTSSIKHVHVIDSR